MSKREQACASMYGVEVRACWLSRKKCWFVVCSVALVDVQLRHVAVDQGAVHCWFDLAITEIRRS